MNNDTCCCCARLLSHIPPIYTPNSEKSQHLLPSNRTLPCCNRYICGACIHSNARFATYCPFCQISTGKSVLSAEGPRDPPAYDAKGRGDADEDEGLPSYESLNSNHTQNPHEKPSQIHSQQEEEEDILHFLDHTHDSMQSLSLRYNIPIDVLRRKNNITADHLLTARRTILIPGEWYKGGVSLSPRPVEGEEEERRRSAVRRFMVGCKVPEYDIAVLYLEQANYDLELAMGVYKDDERWEQEHPIQGNGKGKMKSRSDLGRRRFTGQRS